MTPTQRFTARPAPARAPGLLGLVLASLLLAPTPLRANPAKSYAEQAHGLALDSFRRGRFPEAYGRFVALAEAGHPASARYALWMCETGPTLFGKDWDCAPDQVQSWARTAGVAAPRIEVRTYPSSTRDPGATRR